MIVQEAIIRILLYILSGMRSPWEGSEPGRGLISDFYFNKVAIVENIYKGPMAEQVL